MVHEQLGIFNGRVDMNDVPDIRLELKEIVASQDQDAFSRRTCISTLGSVAVSGVRRPVPDQDQEQRQHRVDRGYEAKISPS